MNATLKRYIPPWDDGVSWAVAALVLLVAVFLASAPLPVAILLSLIAYGGLALARRKEAPTASLSLGASDEESFQIAQTRIAALRDVQNDILDRDVREWIGAFSAKADGILDVIREDRKLRASPIFLQGIIIPSDDLLREYARLERRKVQAAAPVLDRIKRENLPLIDRAADDFYEQLHQIDVIEIDTLSERLEYNLSDRLPAIARGEQ